MEGWVVASQMSYPSCDVEVVCESDTVSGSDLQHFVFAIAVKGGPLDADLLTGGD